MEQAINSKTKTILSNLFIIGFLIFLFFSTLNTTSIERTTFVIKKGMSLNSLTNVLYEKNIINNKAVFKYSVVLRGLSGNIPTGTFVVEGNVSNGKIIETIFNDGPMRIKITFPEGLRSDKIIEKINATFGYDTTNLISDPAFVNQFGINSSSLEGYLYPDTYYFFYDMNAKQILTVMVNQFWNNFDESLLNRANELGLTVHEVVTLASIIEGEAMIDSERTTISSVYHNRLKKRMKLQADPTIQYLFIDGPKTLLTKHLTIDSPYNTYMYYGLPPGPINSPGIKSIKAALYPEDTDYLYFVAKGDGSHVFSTNEFDHLKAKRAYKKQKRMK